jgi:putative DNA primase/helicase
MDFKPNKPKKDPSIYLNKVWNASMTLTGTDPVCKYLRSRGIRFIPDNVRYCPECYESDTKQNYQAMVARVMNAEGKPVSLHVTYLKDGKKADIKSPKKIMTPTEPLNVVAIQLHDSRYIGETLGVAEGLETALSASKLFGMPVWSCMSAGLMEKWLPLKGVEYVTVYSDNDYNYAGQKSAYKLANILYNKGFKVQVQIPPEFGDFNDVLMKGNL